MRYGFPEVEREVLSLYDLGYSYIEIANKVGHCASYVRAVCTRNGRTKKNPTPHQRKVYEMYSDGKSVKEISNLLGKEQKAIRQTLQKADLLKVQEKRPAKCTNCGNDFIARDDRAKYCCKACEREASHKVHDAERRSREKKAVIDRDITLSKVCKIDNSTCYLCGRKVDWDDFVIVNGRKKPKGDYPSIDHVKPLALGGKHCWDNVRLAHMRCNCAKGVRDIG